MKTTKYLLLSIALCFGILAGANAQLTTPNGKRSDEINRKMHEVDMLLQIMPLLLTKEQINQKILPAIEKNRETLRKELVYEDDELAKMEPMLDDALTAAYEKGTYPAHSMAVDVSSRTAKLALQSKIIVGIMVDNMIDVLNKTLDAGQMKALIGSFDPSFIDPSAKPGTLTDDRKLRFFVQRVFLDPISYEILKKLGSK